jgi:hypothetical protein
MKLVIKTCLYYDAGSEKYQIVGHCLVFIWLAVKWVVCLFVFLPLQLTVFVFSQPGSGL